MFGRKVQTLIMAIIHTQKHKKLLIIFHVHTPLEKSQSTFTTLSLLPSQHSMKDKRQLNLF